MTDFVPFEAGLWLQASRTMAYNAGAWVSQGQAVLIDPGVYPDEIDHLSQAVADLGARVVLIVLTHSHWDHLLGPRRLAGVPQLAAHVGYRDQARLYGDHIGRQIAGWEEREGLTGAGSFSLPEPGRWLLDADTIAVGALRLQCLHIPGHAADQIGLFEAQSGALWAADMLSDLEIPFVSHSLRAYRETLRRLSEMPINGLIPGHGAPAINRATVLDRLNADRTYLEDLYQRVDTAVSAGKSKVETVTACVDMHYRCQSDMERYHRYNVESAYVELGGRDKGSPTGWDREWTEETL